MEDGVLGDVVSFAVREVFWWGEDWVQGDAEGVLQHVWDHAVEGWAACL